MLAFARFFRRPGAHWLLVALLACYPLFPGLDMALDRALELPIQLERLLLSTFVFALLTLSVQLQLGTAGLLQLGGAAFYGVGAYAFGVLTVSKLPFQLPFLLALALAAAFGALMGALLGACCARLEGDAVAMVTLSFAEIWRATLLNADSITDGSRGLNPLAQPRLPASFWPASWASDRASFVLLYWLSLALVLAAYGLLGYLARAPLGLAWRAMKADPLAARACGLSVGRLRVQAMAIAGGLAATGGALYASYLTTTAEPSNYDANVSMMALCAVVLGGLGTPAGALAGAAAVVAFDAALSPIVTALVARHLRGDIVEAAWANFANWRWLVFGGLLIVTARLRPAGLLGARR